MKKSKKVSIIMNKKSFSERDICTKFITPEQKLEAWNNLEAMQGQRCAYCEDEISDNNPSYRAFSAAFAISSGYVRMG
jgi:hypothetical protein